MYNSVGVIDENVLDSLGFICNLGKIIGSKTYTTPNLEEETPLNNSEFSDNDIFPELLWVLRDFTLQLLDDDGSNLTATSYLEKVLNFIPKTKSNELLDNFQENKENVRSTIKTYFKSRGCLVMVRPSNKESDLQNLDNIQDENLRPEFLSQVLTLRKKLFTNCKPKTFKGIKLNHESYLTIIKDYIDIMNSGKLPSIESIWNNLCRYETQKASETSGDFAMPLSSIKITSGFGSRKAPKAGASTNHNGIDLAAPLNTPVYSPMDGVVEKIYFNDKGGKQLVIHHSDGSRSGFAHLNGYDVNLNDNVSKGQLIALSGNTGNSTGPHLHFTFRNPKGEPVDPSYFFDINYQNQPGNKVSNLNHNNPGNIHIGGFAQGYGATAGRKDGAGKVAIFPDMQTGMTAMQDLIFGNAYNNLTVSQARNKWVNGSPNATTSSTTPIVKAIGGDFKLNELSGPQRKKLVSEFIKWEDRGVYDNLKTKGLIYKEGGEYELDDNEIQYILANGGQIEYL